MLLQKLSALLVLTSISLFGSNLVAKAETPETKNSVRMPAPGTTSTTATDLVSTSTQTVSQNPNPSPSEVVSVINPGRPTRGVSSYIGVAGNIGLGGDSALGDGAFTVISKIGLTPTFSARPSVVIEDDPVILVPLTYDFNRESAEAFEDTFPIVPYAGAGVAIEASEDADVGLLLTGGVDVPLNTNFTATAAVNAAFLDDTDVGLLIGVGYNFNGL